MSNRQQRRHPRRAYRADRPAQEPLAARHARCARRGHRWAIRRTLVAMDDAEVRVFDRACTSCGATDSVLAGPPCSCTAPTCSCPCTTIGQIEFECDCGCPSAVELALTCGCSCWWECEGHPEHWAEPPDEAEAS